MLMLFEIKYISQTDVHFIRRWFSDDDFDLFTWQSSDGQMRRFELSYAKNRAEHALSWDVLSGYLHHRVDSGEDRGGERYKMCPLLVADGRLQKEEIAELFGQASRKIDAVIAEFVYCKLREYLEPMHKKNG
jgi:hypothetical protein